MSFRQDLLSHALGYATIGVHEVGGNNEGATVNHFQRANGGEPGESWCADFVCCCACEVAFERHPEFGEDFAQARAWVTANFFKTSPACEAIHADSVERGTWRDKGWNPGTGDLVLFDWTGGGVAHHIGVVDSIEPDGTLLTVEGNTSPPGGAEGAASGDGDGVYRKTRSRADVLGFVNLGDS